MVIFNHLKFEYKYFGIHGIITKLIWVKILGKENRYVKYRQNKCRDILENEKVLDFSNDEFRCYAGYDQNLINPKTWDQKIRWLMLKDNNDRRTELSDKYLARGYVERKIGSEFLIPLLGVWDKYDDINFDELPNQFVLKCNHGSGMNIIVKDKENLDKREAKDKIECWMNTNFALRSFELQYLNIKHKILAEKYIEQIDGNLYDYKFHCADGKVWCCQVIGDRNINKHYALQAFYDVYWNRINMTEGSYELYNTDISKPDNYEEMIEIAEKLSEGFEYVRIDLYSVNNKIYFGEYTFSPATGIHPKFKPFELQYEWGNHIKLSC